jgi:hypothetical protein
LTAGSTSRRLCARRRSRRPRCVTWRGPW